MSEQAEEEEMLLDVENTARDSRIYGSTVTVPQGSIKSHENQKECRWRLRMGSVPGVASKDLRSHALTRVV